MSTPAPAISDLQAEALREKFGLSRSYAFELARGSKRPSLELAIQIEQEFGVPAAEWLKVPLKGAAA